MKSLFASILLLTALSAPAHAERWILKNPRSSLATMNAVHSFQFGGDEYVVVNAPKFSPVAASLAASSEEMIPDLRITLPAVRRPISDSANGAEPGAAKAWHVQAMKYDSLPSERDGRNVIVAVLDTGVDYTHSALKDHMWTNPGEIAGNGIDDDGNGFIDDVHGFDFEKDDSDPIDGDAHGTHCAGIIGSSVDSQSGARGVAPGVKIMAVRIIGDEQAGFLSDAVAGVKYAVDNGARVLSNSWRVYRSWGVYDPSEENVELLRKAIEYAGSKGAIFVAAAGNESRNLDADNDPMFPGGFQNLTNMVVVGASDSRNGMSYFSNYGASRVNVAAPGSDIISTVPGNRWESFSGTSMATPLVAGALARGLSASFPMDRAISQISTTTDVMSSWTGKVTAGGIVNLSRFLSE